MADHLDTALRAAASALRDVVAPAVDPTNPLAREQLQLVISWLDFARSRSPYVHDRNRFELAAHADMAAAVLTALGSAGGDDIRAALESARAVLTDPQTGTTAILAATNRLQNIISATVRGTAQLPDDLGRAVEAAVVSHSKHILDAQRVWFLPQSVEPEPDKMPSLQQALRMVSAIATLNGAENG